MISPAVAITPVRPWAHAQEDPVIEIARPIKAAGGAAVRGIVVIAIGTDGWIYAYADDNLGISRSHQGQGHEQDCCTGQQTAHCEPVSPRGQALELPHFAILQNFRVRSKVIFPVSAPCSKITGQYEPESEKSEIRPFQSPTKAGRMVEIEFSSKPSASMGSGGMHGPPLTPFASPVKMILTAVPATSCGRQKSSSEDASKTLQLCVASFAWAARYRKPMSLRRDQPI
jgi:hypothetical protein